MVSNHPGIAPDMTELRRTLPGPWHEADVAVVVHLLRTSGPLPMRELATEPALLDWTAARIENAVVGAWSQDLIFVDDRDLIVAI